MSPHLRFYVIICQVSIIHLQSVHLYYAEVRSPVMSRSSALPVCSLYAMCSQNPTFLGQIPPQSKHFYPKICFTSSSVFLKKSLALWHIYYIYIHICSIIQQEKPTSTACWECSEAEDPYPRSCLHLRAFSDLFTIYLFCSSLWSWDYLILFILSSSGSFKDFVIPILIDGSLPVNSSYAFLDKRTLNSTFLTCYIFSCSLFFWDSLFLCPQCIPFSFTQSQYSAGGIFGVLGGAK